MRRGEKAIRIWVPMPPRQRELAAWEASGRRAEDKPRTRFKLGPVFDRSQVDPLPPPAEPAPLDLLIAPPEGDDLAWALPRLAGLARQLGCTLASEQLPAGCGGVGRFSAVLSGRRTALPAPGLRTR